MVPAADSVDGVGVIDGIEDVAHEQARLVTGSLDAGEYGFRCTIYGGSERDTSNRMGVRAAVAVS